MRLETLLSVFDSAEDVLAAPPDRVAAVPGMTPAVAANVAQASPARGAEIVERTETLGASVLVPADPAFPTALTTIPDAPTLLFARGQIDLLVRDAVAIVGSRSHTRYGADACRFFAAGLARRGLAVVSGMARGLDAVAHAAALDAGGASVGVLGHGLGVVYPLSNHALFERMERDGCLLTEFPPHERPKPGSFPRRNRLISGLARLTLVVEAREKSGALITVDRALAQGRDVLAVPGPITSPMSAGCNRLIQQGAKSALGLRDVLEEYGLADDAVAAARLPTDLLEAERRVLDLLDTDAAHVDDVARRLGAPPADALAVLTSLEIRGVVVQEPGKRFRRVVELVAR